MKLQILTKIKERNLLDNHIMEMINDNAYKMDLLGEYVSYLFSVSNLSLFDVGDDLRMNPFKQKENDEIQTTPGYLLKVEVGP